MAMKHIRFLILLLVLVPAASLGQLVFEVISLDGGAKVQRAQKKTWENLNARSVINNNDIVETFFKTKCILQFGDGNIVILGSNTKALLNISEEQRGGKTLTEVSLTLFGGGLFAKATSSCYISVFTANGIADFDSGAVSAIVDVRTGETGFQVLGGNVVNVRNITQQRGRILFAGQTTMILPEREPTAPLFLTNRHVVVLQHFFGDEYISNELKEAGIKPTEEVAGGTHLRLSQNLMMGTPVKKNVEQGTYPRQFNLDRIYGSIIDDAGKKPTYKKSPGRTKRIFDNRFDLGIYADMGVTDGEVFPRFTLVPSFSLSVFDIGLRLNFAKNHEGAYGFYGFSGGVSGILDCIDHVEIGKRDDSRYIYLGALEDYTLSDGLIVNRFSNRNPYSLFQPLGLSGRASLAGVLDINGFVEDVSRFSCGGIHVLYEPQIYYLGAGYYFDFNQYAPLTTGAGDRYGLVYDSLPDSETSSAHFCEVDLGVDFLYTEKIRARILLQYAHKLFNGRDGFALRVPGLKVDWKNMQFGGGLTVESGRALSSQFSWFYPTNRYRVVDTSSTSQPQPFVFSQNGIIDPKRVANGFHLSYGVSPVKGLSLEGEYKQDFLTRLMYKDSSGADSSIEVDNNYELYVAAVMDEGLVKHIKQARLFVRQVHGGLYPADGGFFSSWGTQAGFFVQSAPLVFNIALECGASFYYLDLDGRDGYPNNRVDSEDVVVEFFAGARWGFF